MKCVFVDKNDCGYRRSMIGSEKSRDVACSLCEQSESYPATSALPDTGHGAEEERAERGKIMKETMEQIFHWVIVDGMDLQDALTRILAAADAVPGPEVEWTGEPPGEPGWYWMRTKAPTPARVVYVGGSEYIEPQDWREWWPVPISAPPVTKGEG